MPHFKTIAITSRNDAGVTESLRVDIKISADGTFYANVPEDLAALIDSSFRAYSARPPAGMVRVVSATFDALHRALAGAHKALLQPEITEEHVIRFALQSSVSFAITDSGELVPNAGFPGAAWPDRETRLRYGDHTANDPARGGYSLTIGARAVTKRIARFGSVERITYSNYYGGGSHLGHDNPANLLNSWTSFQLPENAREIPYTDEAALFFHRLLLGMAELSHRIQEATFTTDRLESLIASQSGIPLLMGPAKGR